MANPAPSTSTSLLLYYFEANYRCHQIRHRTWKSRDPSSTLFHTECLFLPSHPPQKKFFFLLMINLSLSPEDTVTSTLTTQGTTWAYLNREHISGYTGDFCLKRPSSFMHRATLDQGSSIIKTGPYHFLAPRKTVVKEVQWLTHQLQLNRSDFVLVSIYLAASGLSCSTRDFCCIRQGLLSRRMGSGVCWLRSCRAQA